MQQYTKARTTRYTEQQDETLNKLKYKYHVDVSQFIRIAVAEKLKRDYKIITTKEVEEYCPF